MTLQTSAKLMMDISRFFSTILCLLMVVNFGLITAIPLCPENGVDGEDVGPDCRQSSERSGDTRASGLNAINWPGTGSKVQIWSLLSRRKDGFLRVTDTPLDKDEDGNHYVFKVDAKGKMDKDNTIFQLYQLPQTIEGVYHPMAQNVMLAIPGENVNRERNSIYVLISWPLGESSDHSGGTTLAAMRFDYRLGSNLWPAIGEDVAEHVQFTAIYNEHINFYELRDHIENVGYRERNEEKFHYLRVDGGGVVSRAPKRDTHVQPFSNNPGNLFYIVNMGSNTGSGRETATNDVE